MTEELREGDEGAMLDDVEEYLDPEELNGDNVITDDGPDIADEDDEIEDDMGEPSGATEDEVMDAGDWEHAFTGHTGEVYSVAFHPTDPTLLVSGSGDDTAFIWSLNQEVPPLHLKHHTDSIVNVGYSHDGKYLLTGGMDGVIVVWNNVGRKVIELDGCGEVQFAQWHNKGNIIIAGGGEGTMWMWAVPSGQVMRVFSGHAGAVTCGTFSPDGKMIVTGGEDGTIRIWSPKDGNCNHTLSPHEQGATNSITILDVSHDNGIVAYGDVDGNILIAALHNGKIIQKLKNHNGSIESIAFSVSHPLLATGDVDGKICIWETTTWKLRAECSLNDTVVCLEWYVMPEVEQIGVKIDAEVPVLISGCADGQVAVWDGRSTTLLRDWKGHSDAVLDVCLSSDGRRVASCGSDHSVLVFEF